MTMINKMIKLLLVVYVVGTQAVEHSSVEEALDNIIQKEFGFSGDQLVNLVARRYYFVHRLTAAYSSLHDLYTNRWSKLKKGVKEKIVTLPDNLSLRNPAVQLAALRMRNEKTLRPLFRLWDELVHYKLLTDEQFLKEFVHLFYIISHNALVHMVLTRHKAFPEIKDQLNPEEEAELIDLWWESIRQGKIIIDPFGMGLMSEKNINQITVNEVMGRFYHLKRLADAHKIVMQRTPES